ncbi:MAG: thiamine diphosphokinase [Fimbriimonadaceae bacterium]
MRLDPTSDQRVLAVLGGSSLSPGLLGQWARSASIVAAADGGADALFEAAITPDYVVGDLDSLRTDRSLFADVREDASQASTDCDKLLAALAADGHSNVTLINVAGDLPDHELAILHSAAKSGLNCRLVFDRGFGHVLVGPTKAEFEASGRVSLLPLSYCAKVSMRGVRWPLDDADLDPLGLTSISNSALEPFIQVSVASGAAFLFIEGVNTPSWPR